MSEKITPEFHRGPKEVFRLSGEDGEWDAPNPEAVLELLKRCVECEEYHKEFDSLLAENSSDPDTLLGDALAQLRKEVNSRGSSCYSDGGSLKVLMLKRAAHEGQGSRRIYVALHNRVNYAGPPYANRHYNYCV